MVLLIAELIETSNTTVSVADNSGVPTTTIVTILVVLMILIMLLSAIIVVTVCLCLHGKTSLPIIVKQLKFLFNDNRLLFLS